ncbi:MAG: MCE family protein, partial [Deltaproteobacteria bacterium]|nr:MCE family protein [Deltaproteobacteria bacterium]
MRWFSRLVSLVVIAAAIAALAWFIKARVPASNLGQSFTTWAKFRDASKLVVGSPIVIAGVRIGEVSGLTIEGRLARIDMRLVDDTEVPVDSFVIKRAPGTFGDSYLEIIPSGGDEGASSERLLRSGEPILHVLEGSSTDAALRATAASMPKLEAGVDALHSFMVNGRSWVNGTMLGGLTTMDDWLESGRLHNPLRKTNDAFDKIEAATGAATDALGGTDTAMLAKLARVDDAISKARTTIRDSKQAMLTGFADTRSGMDGLDETVDQAAEVMGAIERGSGDDWRGTLGRAISDPTLADSLADATADAAEGVSAFARFRAYLGVRFELNVASRLARVYMTAEIRARNDKFYLIELQKGLLGGVPTDTLSDAAGTSPFIRRLEIRDELRFTAQFGKVFGPFIVRGGIKDSTFGFGADFVANRFRVSADVFGSYQRTPNLKLTASLMVFRSIYLVGGVDDTLNAPGELSIARGNTDIPKDFERTHFGRDY